tara:strand:+ start:84 stop:194 length:111 start_codon:yes stop_codon:yes gene_type:complete
MVQGWSHSINLPSIGLAWSGQFVVENNWMVVKEINP